MKKSKALLFLAAPALVIGLAACNTSQVGSQKAGASPTTAPSKSAPAPTPAGLQIEITSFGPSGHNIEVDFQATNSAGSQQRFYWNQYVLTAPDGTKHLAYRDPASAPYEMIDSDGGSFADGGIFQFSTFTPGQYQISYAGKVLQTATL